MRETYRYPVATTAGQAHLPTDHDSTRRSVAVDQPLWEILQVSQTHRCRQVIHVVFIAYRFNVVLSFTQD